MTRQLAAAVLALLACEATAEVSFEEAVIEELRCERRPAPLPILEALDAAGMLDHEGAVRFDSVSCFPIKGGVLVRGLRFDSVCAHEEDTDLRARRPDLLWRGPGTSPGQRIDLGTAAPLEVVRRWHARNVGTVDPGRAITTEFTSIGDPVEVSCNSFMLP